jgi:hypothetical protein
LPLLTDFFQGCLDVAILLEFSLRDVTKRLRGAFFTLAQPPSDMLDERQ